MSHEWISDVLRDLRDFALKNDLPATAEKVSEALDVARHELGRKGLGGNSGSNSGGTSGSSGGGASTRH